MNDTPHHPATALPSLPTVGQRLRFARRRAGYSQEDAASAIYRSRTILYSIESDRRDAGEEYLALLADLYHVPLAWLRDGGSAQPQAMMRFTDGPDGAIPASLLGKCVFDEVLYDRIMDAESLEDLDDFLPRSPTGYRSQVITPMSADLRVVGFVEAQAKQSAVDAHLAKLVAQAARHRDESN
jgi:transcriptional regulator with XRE-family HTH domain